ncbi:hypothetical protein B9479_000389 [Cryptococcus floricola]|uniref:Major facilitator superfamily (MFS) profile domain-containing protein n=1 Tax=Cryptococcus floricola TaxID=2591691 RepID=A0A5D3BA21_9TREE|nr:hypothetical protein B9479_000389 [Cryptococcus floricola]
MAGKPPAHGTHGHHPSALPPYLRPSISHSSSTSSVHSALPQPQPQQHEYVPGSIFDAEGVTGSGLEERAIFDTAMSRSGTPVGTPLPRTDPLASPLESELNWDAAREGSIARRPYWRRPSPKWVYPFILGAAVSLGMATPPKSELFINLACLAHPPSSEQTVIVNGHGSFNAQIAGDYQTGWQDQADSSNSAVLAPVDQANATELSPSDRWFLKLQHEIFAYRQSHRKTSVPGGRRERLPPGPQPTGPLPRPGGDEPWGDHEPERSGEDDKEGQHYQEIDPSLCKKNPKVQATAAKLTMIMTLTMGILSALTTGFWGQTSDRLGRTKVMAVVELGLLCNELCFILVATFPYLAPGGYYALLLGPVIDGSLGGISTITATINAYLSDVTPDGSRVTVFARVHGIMMAGFATGPVLGSMLISYTGNIMTPFYVNVLIHSVYIILILFLLPESLSSEARVILTKNAALAKDAAARREAAEREWEDEEVANDAPRAAGDGNRESDPLLSGWSIVSATNPSRRRKRFAGNVRRTIRKTFSFLDPLTIFFPRTEEDAWTGRERKNWNMTIVGLGLFFMSLLMGVLATKVQYSLYAFGWTSTQLGPYMSAMAFLRSAILVGLVPLIMRYVKPRFQQGNNTGVSEAQTYAAGDSAITTSSDPSVPEPSSDEPSSRAPPRSAYLDLLTVRICLFNEFFPWVLLAFGPSEKGFILLSALLTLGGPGVPASNSLALSLLPDPSQAGRLFGALAVIHALGSTLISPLMFGTVFAATVGTYAPTIFALAACCVAGAFGCMAMVRLDRDKKDSGEEERGRSKKVKRVNSSSVYGASGVTMRSEMAGASGLASASGVGSGAD